MVCMLCVRCLCGVHVVCKVFVCVCMLCVRCLCGVHVVCKLFVWCACCV